MLGVSLTNKRWTINGSSSKLTEEDTGLNIPLMAHLWYLTLSAYTQALRLKHTSINLGLVLRIAYALKYKHTLTLRHWNTNCLWSILLCTCWWLCYRNSKTSNVRVIIVGAIICTPIVIPCTAYWLKRMEKIVVYFCFFTKSDILFTLSKLK